MKQIIYLLFASLFIFSCENVIMDSELATTSPEENFEYFWNEVNENYAYFDLKGINWNIIKVEYKDYISQNMSDETLFNVLSMMLGELNDGHNNLVSDFNKSYSYVTYSGNDNYDRRIVFDNYTSESEYETGPFKHSFLENGKIGYIRFSEFTGMVDDENLDFILNRFKSTEGLIIDIRENPGGVPSDIFNILSRFVAEETLIYYTRYKLPSTDPNSFSEISSSYIQPSDKVRYPKKVMVLIDSGTYSAGSFFALATKAIPQLTLIGDTTSGGLGLPNGGQLPNGWTYRFSVTQTLNLDKDPSWENGVPPDIFVELDWNDRTKDEIIESAIKQILN